MEKSVGWTGVILAGGRSRRFGSDKAFALYEGERFIDRTLRVMKNVFGEVVIVTNTPEKFRDFSKTALLIQDDSPFQGPLGGIVTALRTVSSSTFVSACDMPLLFEETILRLLKEDDGSDLVAFEGEKGLEPLCALYRISLLPILESRLQNGRLNLLSLATERISIKTLSVESTDRRSLINVNTQDEYRALCQTR